MATCRSWTAWPGVVNRRESRRDADPRPSRPRKSGRYRFSWRGVRLARREEGAARRAVTDEATPSAGRPSVPVSWRGVRLARREEGAARRAVTGARQCAPRGPGVGLGAQPRLRKTKQRRPGGRLAGNWPGSGVGSRIAGAVPQVDVWQAGVDASRLHMQCCDHPAVPTSGFTRKLPWRSRGTNSRDTCCRPLSSRCRPWLGVPCQHRTRLSRCLRRSRSQGTHTPHRAGRAPRRSGPSATNAGMRFVWRTARCSCLRWM